MLSTCDELCERLGVWDCEEDNAWLWLCVCVTLSEGLEEEVPLGDGVCVRVAVLEDVPLWLNVDI